MKEWWNGLAARERRTLLVGGVALAAILYYFMLWLPPRQAVTQLRASVAEQRETLAWMRQAAAEARALSGRSSAAPRQSTGQALYALADQTARKAGLGKAIQRVEPSGDDKVRVNLRGAAFDSMINWLARLRNEHGIEASPVSVRAADAPGRVDVQLVLVGGGA
ncbi:MAG: type II secretion system protein M [Ectothiorhodospiraceae bacterium]|jgi:general secretion pathway protein M